MTCLDQLEEVVAQQYGEVRVDGRAVRVRRSLSAHLLRSVVSACRVFPDHHLISKYYLLTYDKNLCRCFGTISSN